MPGNFQAVTHDDFNLNGIDEGAARKLPSFSIYGSATPLPYIWKAWESSGISVGLIRDKQRGLKGVESLLERVSFVSAKYM